jgi:hypothetical protein
VDRRGRAVANLVGDSRQHPINECVVVRPALAPCDHIKGNFYGAFQLRDRLVEIEHIGLQAMGKADDCPPLQASIETWLGDSAGVELLCSAPENLLHVWPVSKRVNRSGTGGDDPTLIDRIAS